MILCELAQLVQEETHHATSYAEENRISIHTQFDESSGYPTEKTAPVGLRYPVEEPPTEW